MFRKTPLLPLKYLFISDVDMEASPRKKKRNAKDAKKSAKQRAEKSTNSIDKEVSLITINWYRFVIKNFRHFTHILKGVMRTSYINNLNY